MENQENKLFEESRERGLQERVDRDYQVRNIDKYRSEEEVPEFLRYRNIQDYWDKDNKNENMSS